MADLHSKTSFGEVIGKGAKLGDSLGLIYAIVSPIATGMYWIELTSGQGLIEGRAKDLNKDVILCLSYAALCLSIDLTNVAKLIL